MTALVLLSGWGIDARIWQPLAPHWPADLAVSTPDWPGYGDPTAPPLAAPDNLSELAARMAPALPTDAVWVGWSLGALLATRLLDHLPAPRALVRLGMGARFCHPQGVSAAELTASRRAFARRPAATWQHFLRWQLQGEPAPRHAQRQLRGLIGTTPSADFTTLEAGLAQLASLDVGDRLDAPPCPVHHLAGDSDPLLAPEWRASADRRLPDAGHCPMLSCPEALAACLTAIARDARPSPPEERLP